MYYPNVIFMAFISYSSAQVATEFPEDPPLTEGRECRHSSGIAGTCTDYENCPRSSFRNLLANTCGFIGQRPFICCPKTAGVDGPDGGDKFTFIGVKEPEVNFGSQSSGDECEVDDREVIDEFKILKKLIKENGQQLAKIQRMVAANHHKLNTLEEHVIKSNCLSTKSVDSSNAFEIEKEFLEALPMKNRNDLDIVFTSIKDNKVAEYLKSQIIQLGGYNLVENTRRIMNYLLSYKFAKEVNISGVHGKAAFGNKILMELIFKSIQQNKFIPTITTKEVERQIGRWLYNARDRGPSQRKTPQQNHMETDQQDD